MITCENTRRALTEYDRTLPSRAAAWEDIEAIADVDACVEADRAALELVQLAFHRDTSHINSLENCLRVDLEFMRRMASSHA